MPRKMTKFVLNGLCEDINFFWKGQVVVIKSRVVGYVFLLECYTMSAKIQQFPFLFIF